jgi:hypothetical protein
LSSASFGAANIPESGRRNARIARRILAIRGMLYTYFSRKREKSNFWEKDILINI